MPCIARGILAVIELLTGDDIYAHILMLQATTSAAVVLIEGPDDGGSLSAHFDPSVTTIPTGGKRNLLSAIVLVDTNSLARVLGIYDRDFEGILGEANSSPNLVQTDRYDLDATIILDTDVAYRLAMAFGSQDSVSTHCQEIDADGPLDAAVAIAGEAGCLRLASTRSRLGLSLRDFPIPEVMTAGGRIDRERLVSLAVARSSHGTVDGAEAREALEAELDGEVDIGDTCSGHDLGAALAALCRGPWGGSSVSSQHMLNAVRAALGCADLAQLGLFRRVRDWEARSAAKVWHDRCRTYEGAA